MLFQLPTFYASSIANSRNEERMDGSAAYNLNFIQAREPTKEEQDEIGGGGGAPFGKYKNRKQK